MKLLLNQKRAEHQNHNNSLEKNHQKNENGSPKKYKLFKKDEVYGQIGKLNVFNIQLNNGEYNSLQDQKYGLKNRNKYSNTKNLINFKKEQIFAKEREKITKIKPLKKKENSKENVLDLNKTEYDYHYSIKTDINHYFKNCNLILKNKISTEIETYLDSLWKQLGVNENYISNFNSIKNNFINIEEKNNLIISEIEYLVKFKDILDNLVKVIGIRENKLNELKILLEKISKEGDTNIDKKYMNDLIYTYLNNSIRIIEYWLLYREILNQGNFKNKFNEEIIKKNFDITRNDMNYLTKMKTDTNFLINLKLNDIKINKDVFNLFKGDPFLTSFNNINQQLNEYKEKIKYCQYYLIQETIHDSCNKVIKEAKTNSARKKSQSHISINAAVIPKKNLNNNKFIEERKNPEENIINNNLNIINTNNNNINIIDNNNNNINIIDNTANRDNNEINNNDNLNISYYSGKLSEFIPIYNEYFQKIPSEQKTIFHLQDEPLNYFKHNYYPKIILCKDTTTNEIKGLCIYSIIFKDHEKKPNQIIIQHISSYNEEEMENILTKIFEFIKNNHILNDIWDNSNTLFTEMYIDLYYYLENEKFEINKNIRDFIGKKIKFRWVKLENISKVIRFQKMKFVISNKEREKNIRDSMIRIDNGSIKSNISINDFCVLNFIKNIINNNGNQNENEILDNINEIMKINPYNIVYILSLMKKIFNIKTIFEQILDKIKIFCINNKLSIPDNELINNDNNSINLYTFPLLLKQLGELFSTNNENKLDISNKNEILPLFDGCIGTRYNNYYYNRIESIDLKILKDNETEQIFYLIKSKHKDNISLLISFNLNENFKNKYLLSNEHMSLYFKDIYNGLSEVETEQNEKESKYIYIPAFTMDKKIEIINNEKKQEEKDIINYFEEKYNIEFLTEDIIIRNNNKLNNNFEYDLIEDDVKNNKINIIDDDFVIFVLDFDVIEQIEIIPVMSINVKKENFISNL